MSEFPSFFRLGNIPSYVYTTSCLYVHLLKDTWVACSFRLLWVILLWTCVYNISLRPCLQSFGYAPRRGIGGSYGSFVFNFLMNCHILLHPLQYSCLENPTEEPGRLQSMGSLRAGHDWATSLSLFTFLHWRRKWQPTPVFLPGKSHGWRGLVGCSP